MSAPRLVAVREQERAHAADLRQRYKRKVARAKQRLRAKAEEAFEAERAATVAELQEKLAKSLAACGTAHRFVGPVYEELWERAEQERAQIRANADRARERFVSAHNDIQARIAAEEAEREARRSRRERAIRRQQEARKGMARATQRRHERAPQAMTTPFRQAAAGGGGGVRVLRVEDEPDEFDKENADRQAHKRGKKALELERIKRESADVTSALSAMDQLDRQRKLLVGRAEEQTRKQRERMRREAEMDFERNVLDFILRDNHREEPAQEHSDDDDEDDDEVKEEEDEEEDEPFETDTAKDEDVPPPADVVERLQRELEEAGREISSMEERLAAKGVEIEDGSDTSDLTVEPRIHPAPEPERTHEPHAHHHRAPKEQQKQEEEPAPAPEPHPSRQAVRVVTYITPPTSDDDGDEKEELANMDAALKRLEQFCFDERKEEIADAVARTVADSLYEESVSAPSSNRSSSDGLTLQELFAKRKAQMLANMKERAERVKKKSKAASPAANKKSKKRKTVVRINLRSPDKNSEDQNKGKKKAGPSKEFGKRRAVPHWEAVERSKRHYDELPEVKRRREEAQRKKVLLERLAKARAYKPKQKKKRKSTGRRARY